MTRDEWVRVSVGTHAREWCRPTFRQAFGEAVEWLREVA